MALELRGFREWTPAEWERTCEYSAEDTLAQSELDSFQLIESSWLNETESYAQSLQRSTRAGHSSFQAV